MKSSVRDEEIRKMSTDISRHLLSDISLKGSEHCDIFIEEYLSSPENYDLKGAPQRHGFVDIGMLTGPEMICALVSAAVVEVAKYFFSEVKGNIATMNKTEKVEILSARFSDEAIKMGLTPVQVEDLAKKFSEVLCVNPFLNP